MSENKAFTSIDIESEDIHELLGITVDSKLTFETHINKFCQKASHKLNTLA